MIDQRLFLKLLGPTKPRCKLRPTTIEKIDCGLYIQEKVEYYVEDQEKISAYVLVPKYKSGKKPAIFCHHQHASNYDTAKSEMVGIKGNADLAYAKELAELGYVTLAPDAIAFEERNWHTECWWGVEYFELATRIVQGQTLIYKVLRDISVGIDYLVSREEVDDSNIGFLGHSYGARMAIWAPPFDKRIKVTVANGYCLNLQSGLDKNSGTRIPMELCIPGILEHGDVQDIVKLVPPCALYLSVGKDDKWSKDAEKIYEYAKNTFEKDQIKLKIWPGGHAFSEEMRIEAYSFFENKFN